MGHPTFDDLKREAILVGDGDIVWPIDEIRLSTEFSNLPGQLDVVHRLIHEMFNHPNMHVRRIAVSACRRSSEHQVPGLAEALALRLSDSEAWVRYDAAWAVEATGVDSKEIRDLLSRNADGVVLPEDLAKVKLNPRDAELQARARARKTLNTIETKGAQRFGR